MGTEGYSLADIKAVTGEDNGLFGGNGILALIIVFILLFGNNGFGGFGVRNNNMYDGGAVTQGELQRSFDTHTIVNKLDGITNGLCDGFYAVNKDMRDGFTGVNGGLADLGYQAQICCCETNKNIQSQTQTILDKLCAMESAQKDLRIADLQCKVNQYDTVNTILNAQGRYVTNPPCPQYNYNCGYGCGC